MNDIDKYIQSFPEAIQQILNKVRDTLKEAAPGAEETIKYRIPTLTLHGNLIHYAAFKNHLGIYPAPSGTEAFKKELSGYQGGKGSIRFPFNKPIPYDLIDKIVRFRVMENSEKAKAKKKIKRAFT